jgi:hypothetical protein
MQVKIKITTPKGQAKGTLNKLKPFLIGFNKVKHEAYVNQDDNEMYLECEGTPRQILNISRNANLYSSFVEQIFKKKVMGKGIADLAANKEDIMELENMLKEGTKVEVIKQASAQELVDNNKSMWQRMKEGFIKV